MSGDNTARWWRQDGRKARGWLTACALSVACVSGGGAVAQAKSGAGGKASRGRPGSSAKAQSKPKVSSKPRATLHQTKPSKSKLRVSKPNPYKDAKTHDPHSNLMSLPTGENKTGVSSKAISVPKGPGTIKGMGESFSAQASTGIATFSVPFALPKARGAVQPSLALSYSSAAGNGIAGVGWSFAIPYISRQTRMGVPHYRDSAAWHPGQDRFVYNGGQELVPVKDLLPGEELPAWFSPGWQYFRPRVEGSYLRFFWNASQRLWRVQDKSGSLLEFGAALGTSDALETNPSDADQVFRYNLKRQLDPRGNEIRYVYGEHNGGRQTHPPMRDPAHRR